MTEGVAKISVRVHPGATRNEVVSFTGGILQVRVSAPPVKGKANRELIAFLSRLLNVSRSRVDIVTGRTSRSKVIAIDGLTREEIMQRLFSSSGADASR